MNRKIATVTLGLAAAGLVSAPMAAAAPGDSAGAVNNVIGQAISSITKNGGGAPAVLTQLQNLKTTNPGLATALQNAAKNLQTKVNVPNATDISAVRTQIGQAISTISKNGGGASAVLTQLQTLKASNPGLANALSKLAQSLPKTPVA